MSENSGELSKPKEGNKETLVHFSGRETDALVKRKEKIGEGEYGNIYRAETSVLSDNEKIQSIKDKYFVVKEFKQGYEVVGDAEKRAKKAMFVYEALKKAGIETWTTYRQIKDKNKILMTDGERGGYSIVSPGNKSKSKELLLYSRQSVDDVDGFEQVVRTAVENAYRAGQSGILVLGDAWFASLQKKDIKKKFSDWLLKREPRQRVGVAKVFIGDYDNIDCSHLSEDEKLKTAITYKNLLELYSFFDHFASQFLSFRAVNKGRDIFLGGIKEKAEEIDAYEGKVGRWDQVLKMYEKERRSHGPNSN